MNFSEVKDKIDSYINILISERKKDASRLHPSYERLWDYINSVAINGKRIRPYLTCVAYGSDDNKILPVAVAQELLHIAVLMHDDIIDQDFIRHGKDNLNGLYEKDYQNYDKINSDQKRHYAYGASLLAGDLLLSEAYRCINNSNFDENIRHSASIQLSNSIFNVAGGELLDVESAFRDDMNYDPINTYTYKTAYYSFVSPLTTGAICLRQDEKEIEILKKFGIDAGIAFQIQDDLLGVFGDGSLTGKSTYTDLREGKNTILVKYHKEASNGEQTSRLSYIGSSKSTDEQLDLLKQDMVNSGAKEKTEELARNYFENAKRSASNLKNTITKEILLKFLSSISERTV